MQVAILSIITCFCILSVYAQDPPKGRKITFSTITDITNEEVKYNKENPKEGSEEDRQAKRWVSVTSDGYETMGTLQEVMEEMSEETEASKADPSTPGAAALYPEDPHNPLYPEDPHNPLYPEDPHNPLYPEDPHNPIDSEQDPSIPIQDPPIDSEQLSSEGDPHNPIDSEQDPPIDSEQGDNGVDSDDLLTAVEDVLEETKEKRRVFPPDTRIKIRKKTLKRFPWRTMGKIKIGCTGTFIRRRTILTAGHCVHRGNNSPNGWYKYLQFYRAKYCDPYKGYYYNWKRAVTYYGWYRYRYQHYDIAVIITYSPYYNWMAFGWRPLIPFTWYVNINGYPGDKPGYCMWHSHCNYVYHVNYARQYRYRCDTARGMSGSAVYVLFKIRSRRIRIIYGVHAYGYRTHNRATRITRSHFNKLRSWIRIFGGS